MTEFCSTCNRCQLRKRGKRRRAPLVPMLEGTPYRRWGVDCMGPIPTSLAGNNYIILFVDAFTKWIEAFAVPDTTAETTARCLREVISRFGVPEQLHSDNGTNFRSELFTSECKAFGLKQTFTTAYHPAGNGLTERANGTIGMMLNLMVANHAKDWDKWINPVLFAYRTAVHRSTGFTPFKSVHGVEARLAEENLLSLPCAPDVPICAFMTETTAARAVMQAAMYTRLTLSAAKVKEKQGPVNYVIAQVDDPTKAPLTVHFNRMLPYRMRKPRPEYGEVVRGR